MSPLPPKAKLKIGSWTCDNFSPQIVGLCGIANISVRNWGYPDTLGYIRAEL
jgi:hypothetical protein